MFVILTVKDVLTRVKSLRTTYVRLKKGPPSGSGGDKRLTARKAHLFKRLAFLHPHTRTRASKSTLTIDMQDEVCDYQIIKYFFPLMYIR